MTTRPVTPTVTETTAPAPVASSSWSPPTLPRRISAWLNRRPVAMTVAVLVAAAWSTAVFGMPYSGQNFALLFLTLLGGPVIVTTVALPHARRHWWRAVAVPVVIFSAAPESMVPITVAALAWYGYRTGYADAPWGPGRQEVQE